jgi:ATP-binding cassette subfamily B protein
MVVEHFGVVASMERLREVTDTTERGADMGGLEKGAQILGFQTLAAELSYDELLQGDLLPAILHWDRDHFIVVTKASYANISIHDPAQGKRTMSRDDFEAHRYGPGRSRAGLIIRPTQATETQVADAKDSKEASTIWTFPWQISLLGLFYAGATAFGLYTLNEVLQQAIDLQFREGVWQHFGALLLATAGIILAAYLLRRQSISFASASGKREVDRLTKHVEIRAADISRPIDGELYLKLVSDIDNIRVWYAYNLATLIVGVVTIVASVIFLIFTDLIWGLSLLAVEVLLILLGQYVFGLNRESREAAREAQLKQREALYEFARVLPDTHSLDGGKYLLERLQEKNEKAESAFLSISSEYSAERQLIRVLMLVSAISLITFGLYQLGYAGLQVGELLFGIILIALTMVPYMSISTVLLKWYRLQAARLRVNDLGEPGVIIANSLPKKPETLTIVWDGQSGKEQRVTFPGACRIALVGTDKQTREDIIAGLLGRRNDRNVRLFFDGNFDEVRTLTDYGKLSALDRNSLIASGSIASNIAMVDRPDIDAVKVAAELVGIPHDAPPRGLYSLVGFEGEGVSREMASRTLIARAVYSGVDALVLNGVTNNLEAYDEGLLMDNLLPWCKGRLFIMNAERLNAAYGSDLILSIEATELDSVGSHERLLSEKGTYFYQVNAAQS